MGEVGAAWVKVLGLVLFKGKIHTDVVKHRQKEQPVMKDGPLGVGK